MIMMNKTKIIFILAVTILIAGCNLINHGIKSNEVISISLECIQECLKMKDKPFAIKRFEDHESIKKFVKAINQAEKMEGILDYGAIFLMKLSYKNGSSNEYHLN